MSRRRGVTLIELVIALSILGLVLGISGVALATLRLPRESDVARRFQQARIEAIRTGRPVSIPGHRTPDPGSRLLFFPDGRALGAGADPLTGGAHAHR